MATPEPAGPVDPGSPRRAPGPLPDASQWEGTANEFFGVNHPAAGYPTAQANTYPSAQQTTPGYSAFEQAGAEDHYPVPQPGGATCPTCSAVVARDAPFCPTCGASFVVQEAPGPHETAGMLQGPGGLSQPVAGVMTVGRDPRNTLALADPAVSRAHCRLQARAGAVLLSDLGSTNGTWLNGHRVEREEIADGDLILIGRTELRFVTTPFAATEGPGQGSETLGWEQKDLPPHQSK